MYPWSAEPATDSPWTGAAAAMTLGELFQCADPPLALLIAVKRRARRLMTTAAGDRTMDIQVRSSAEDHQLVYFASIAAALVRHGQRISKSSPEVLRVAWQRVAGESSVDEWLRRLLADAGERLSDQGG
jgi:hypothetical protein